MFMNDFKIYSFDVALRNGPEVFINEQIVRNELFGTDEQSIAGKC